MSIDATVSAVIHHEDGSGKLKLIDRVDPRGPSYGGCKGQSNLYYVKAPYEVTALNGLNIWGGSDSIMLGAREIAKRDGYTGIVFCDETEFKEAVVAYHAHAKKLR